MSNLQLTEIKSRLRTKSEKEFRELLIILFEHLGFNEVVHSHGITEFGKDITFFDVDKLGNVKWIACVVKANDVNQSNYHDIARQINECFKKAYNSHTNGKVRIDEVYVITNGIYKANTRELIAEDIDNKNKNVIYKDIGDIAKYYSDSALSKFLVEDKDVYATKFQEHIKTVLNADNSLRLLGADFNLDINSLESFQIRLRTKEKNLKEEASKYLGKKATVLNLDIIPDIDKLLTSNRATLIQGIATSGKTTILKQIGLSQVKRDPSAYVFYIELAKLYSNQTQTLSEFVNQEFHRITGSQNFQFSADKKTLLLLDGLDEVVSDAHKIEVIKQVFQLQKSFKIHFILTSREGDFIDNNELLKEIFEIHELLPLNNNEMIELGKKILNDNDQTRDFTTLLRKSEIANSFPKTPLATIILAILFKEKKLNTRELPKNVYELYSKFIDLFLNKWDKTKGISEQFTIQQKEFVLSKIAEHLHANGQVNIPFEDLHDFLAKLSLYKPIEGLENPEEFLKRICQRSNILIRNEAERSFRFFHLTIQEFLAANSLRKKDEPKLLKNFYDNWWLNPNIFYAGKTPDESAILEKLSKLEEYPSDLNNKISYIIHTSKILQAAHLLDKNIRNRVLKAMIKIFDEMNLELIRVFVDNDEPRFKLKRRTILDRILWARNFFVEFFSSSQFDSDLKLIWEELIPSESLSDITRYCLSYCISVNNKDPKYLLDFALLSDETNVRWFRIVDVDIDIKKLPINNVKVRLKIKRKAAQHQKYIQAQFDEVLKMHYKSITGITPNEK